MTVAPRRLPVLGHLLSLAPNPIGYLQSLRAHGDLVTVYLGPRPVHQVNSPELIRHVLIYQAHDFHRGAIFVQARRALGNGLATADGVAHLRQRRIVQPAFNPDRLATYLPVMHDAIRDLAASWTPHEPIRLDRELARLTLTVTAKALFRTELGEAAVREVRRSLAPVLNGIALRSVLPAIPGSRFPTALHRLRSVVDDVIDAYRGGGVDHGDLLSTLVAANLSDVEVRTQALHILMAGTETTATALSWACYELARHPSVEDQVLREMDAVLGDRDPTMADLARLTYLDRVLTETLRLHTPIWLLLRRSIKSVHMGGFTLPQGAEVLVNLPTLHRDPHLFVDPMRFDPDRWLTPHHAGFMPFGAGAHKCVGADFAYAEMKTAIVTILRQWRLTLPRHHQVREITRAFLRPNAIPMTPSPR
jgi:cytochrome P450